MGMSDKYPYLTAWIGFVMSISLYTLIFSVVTSFFLSTPYLIFLVFFTFIGFLVFRSMVIKHVLGRPGIGDMMLNPKTEGLSSRYPFLTAWIGFILMSLVINGFIMNLSDMIPSPMLTFLISYTIWIMVDFFVFRFVVRRYIPEMFAARSGEIRSSVGNTTDCTIN